MFVPWLPVTPNLTRVNASHGVRVRAFVLNDKREVLVVQENSGRFKGTGAWRLPNGVVNEGEDIGHAVVREVQEETGVDTKFVEVLCSRQDHKSFFTKSDLFFLCVLQPRSSSIERQNVEVKAALWMPIEEYAAQPFIVRNKQFSSTAKICLARANDGYPGFAPLATTTRSDKRSYIYCNNYLGVQENFASSTYHESQKRRGVWIKVPIEHAHLVKSLVKEGFGYRQMLRIRNIFFSFRVLVVTEKGGKFKGRGIWKLLTGLVDEGEDVFATAIREEKEETGIDTEFDEVLASREAKEETGIDTDFNEVLAFRYTAQQPFVLQNKQVQYVAKICSAKANGGYTGFAPLAVMLKSSKLIRTYCNNPGNVQHLMEVFFGDFE
ncbi:nudix hydrolase 2-like [Syzygium oleosum]|uniref:nudix hydrolase 2-like n=1 Tax=Syzygium oleosum TaxID=219896 RepID=UPI0024B97007|nr:nudix hydrolase 2-like [Syzygium oleosum]